VALRKDGRFALEEEQTATETSPGLGYRLGYSAKWSGSYRLFRSGQGGSNFLVQFKAVRSDGASTQAEASEEACVLKGVLAGDGLSLVLLPGNKNGVLSYGRPQWRR
jgi:hypothetical protein